MPLTTKTSRFVMSTVLPNQLPLFDEGESTPVCGACGRCAFMPRRSAARVPPDHRREPLAGMGERGNVLWIPSPFKAE